ncbi:MAG: DUF3391 domain-containing protein [Proteobacteria bacterium]|nr:DUF3391 domain-containing protein [Pseudomonadota bacterium]
MGKLYPMPINESPLSSDHLVKLDCRDLLVGMYVSELDCSWSDTPFPLNGFHLKNGEDIQTLLKFCKSVTIDINRGASPQKLKKSQLTILSSARKSAPAITALKVNRDAYPVNQTIKQQIDKAHAQYLLLQEQFQSVADQVRKHNELELALIRPSINVLVDLILANPQTLIWILNTESSPRYKTAYCVRAAIWATILARQFGLVESEIRLLFLGTLLADIGMQLLPERLVNKRGPFRKKQFLAYRKHVEFGLDLLSHYPDIDERVLRIVRCHHERHDGRGFPRGVRGKQLPPLARFANLAYCFERLLHTNLEERRVSPAHAISRLYKQRELKFPEQLIVEFIHIMGMYPIGSVVELNTGELALVLEQNTSERMFPVVAILATPDQSILAKPAIADLAADQSSAKSRIVSGSADMRAVTLRLEDYTFSFFGKRLGIGPLSFRL